MEKAAWWPRKKNLIFSHLFYYVKITMPYKCVLKKKLQRNYKTEIKFKPLPLKLVYWPFQNVNRMLNNHSVWFLGNHLKKRIKLRFYRVYTVTVTYFGEVANKLQTIFSQLQLLLSAEHQADCLGCFEHPPDPGALLYHRTHFDLSMKGSNWTDTSHWNTVSQ